MCIKIKYGCLSSFLEKCASTDTVHDIVRSVPGLYTVPVPGDEAGGGCSDDNSGALCLAFPTVLCQVSYSH